VIEAVPGGTLTGMSYWWCYRRADVVYVHHYKGMAEIEAMASKGIKCRGPYLAADAQSARVKAHKKLDKRIKAETYTEPKAA
jgi:hypothetical protein